MYNTFTFNYTVVSTGAWAQHPVEYVVLNAASIPLVLLFAVVVRDGATAALPGWADPEGQGAAQRAGAPPAGPGRLILLGTLVEHEVGAHGNRRCWLVATGGRSGLRLRQQRDGPNPGVGPIPWTGQRLSGCDIAAELFLGVAACVMSLDPVSAL